MPPELVLTLTAKEFEYVMNVLGQRPFLEVNALMQKLVQQVNQQGNQAVPG